VLTGDMTALDLRFHVNGTLNNKGKWQITLTPKDKEISLFIARIDMEGADFVERIFLQEKSGDESRIEFMRHSQSHRLNPAESKLFNGGKGKHRGFQGIRKRTGLAAIAVAAHRARLAVASMAFLASPTH
jgi:hypothetical protein